MLRKTIFACALIACVAGSGCFGKKTTSAKHAPAATSAAPDNVLYSRALDDIKHGRFDIARLSLQTLINTYPDSEYLAKAKLAIADSYYKEGGTSGLTQAIAEYKDFITFFPFLDEASYAQMQVGMAYYRMMVKPDRDSSEAVNAEAEFQTFVQKYPNSKLEPQAEQRLREVQEVLAEGDFRISRFYYMRGSNRAAAGRLLELTQRYPLYSRADEADWMLGQIYEKSEKKDYAANFYATIVKNYPLSPLAGDAKARLIAIGAPVPQPDPGALARMQQEQNTPRPRAGLLARTTGVLKNGPDVSMAARVGTPDLEPPSEAGSETLTPGTTTIGGPGASGSAAPGAGTTAVVETVTPGTSGTATGTSDATATSSPTSTGDAQVGNNGPDSPTPSAPGAGTNDNGGAIVGGTASGAVGNTTQGTTSSSSAAGTSEASPSSPSGSAAAPATVGAGACPPATTGSADSTATASTSGTPAAGSSCVPATTTSDTSNESSSKKKKKHFPW
ncbi:MAG: outer membrane protein assembly factor BamD [Candidatus Acidiferrales bacterium]